MASFTLGLNGKLYINTGTPGTPTWTEVDIAQDVVINLEKATSDITTRGAQGWRENAATLRDSSIETSIRYDTTNAAWTAIKDVFFAEGTTIEVLALDGDVGASGSQGLRMTSDVTNFTRNEELEEAMTNDITFVPVPGMAPPEWVTTPLA